MKVRNLVAVASLVVLTIVITVGALRAQSFETDNGYARLDHQAFKWRVGPFSTSSEQFVDLAQPGISGDEGLVITNQGPTSVQFSGDFTGAPVDIRAIANGQEVRSGIAHFDPAGGTSSFSFGFVNKDGERGCHEYRIQWRSPTGEEVTFNHGSFVVRYRHTPRDKNGGQFACQ
jgi:hypothetical protein